MKLVFSCLSVGSLLYIVFVSADSVPIPENVTVTSLDMGLVLRWDPPQNTTNQLFSYTAEVKAWRDYEPVCVHSSSLRCDFTDNVSTFGLYQLRVRTELHGETSDWVETEEFAVDNITEVSAPRVKLSSRKGQTEVDITDPPMRKNNLRDVFFTGVSYIIRFWEEGAAEKKDLTRDQNRIMLPNLEPLVNYCVEVAILYNKKTSQFSNTTCVTNSPSSEVEPWLIAVVLLVSFLVVLVAIVLIFLAMWYGYQGCRIIFPDTNLPENLKQFLSQQSQSPILSAMQESTQLKEHFHELRIFHTEPDSSQDKPQMEGSGIQTEKDECCTGADVTQRSKDTSETASTTSEEQHLLAEYGLS
ncbi:cytokine receptor family member b4 [Pimephales promelas]|uniref:cytokine receptor family member b4 n=1 Tax=Pimephales promelas TaxID=90988 RepID=UPI0019559909|nr:cytokine receptor family member b4 [Pimephales promelas]KAG1929077.1 interleukin-10 receptor subunit beta [Pimephales promelas]